MGSAATVLLNKRLHYRPEYFRKGLERCGFQVADNYQNPQSKADLLVLWNRMPRQEPNARTYEKKGRLLITENAWIGPQSKEGHWFTLLRNHHNIGGWNVGDTPRLPKLGISLQNWRTSGSHILVLPQRGIGEVGVAMPRDWTSRVVKKLKQHTDREIRVRSHPGRRPHPPLEPDLRDCWAVVTWASGAAIKSLIKGYPVFYDLEGWIAGSACKYGIRDIESPLLGDREQMLEHLAWAQWSGDEIRNGEPFEWVLKSTSSTPMERGRAVLPRQ